MHAKKQKTTHVVTIPYASQENEAFPQYESSFDPPIMGQGPPSLSLQVPDAPVQDSGMEVEGATTMPPNSSAEGLAPQDVVVDMSGQSSRLC